MANRPIILDPEEIRVVLDELQYALDAGMAARVWDDEGTFKVKIGFGMWTHPLGVPDPHARVE